MKNLADMTPDEADRFLHLLGLRLAELLPRMEFVLLAYSGERVWQASNLAPVEMLEFVEVFLKTAKAEIAERN